MNFFELRPSLHQVALTIVVALVLSGCASSLNQQNTKWDPEKRADAHVSLGLDYLRRGQYQVALEELQLAVSIAPNSDRAHHASGLLSSQTGFVDAASKSFARAVRLNPSNFVAVNDFGIFRCQNGDYDGGISVLAKIEGRQDNQQRNNTLLGLGLCHYQKRNYDDAKIYLRRVLSASPRLHQALLPMADISYREAKYLNARAFIERYISVGAMSETALVLGANTELQLGDGVKARQYAQELRRLFPRSTELAAFRELLSKG